MGRAYVPVTPLLGLLLYIALFESGIPDVVGLSYLGSDSYLFEAAFSRGSNSNFSYLGFSNSFFFFALLARALYRWLR